MSDRTRSPPRRRPRLSVGIWQDAVTCVGEIGRRAPLCWNSVRRSPSPNQGRQDGEDGLTPRKEWSNVDRFPARFGCSAGTEERVGPRTRPLYDRSQVGYASYSAIHP